MHWALVIRNEIWEDKELNFTEKLIIGRIYAFAIRSPYMNTDISNEQLAKDLDLTPHTISRYIASIEKKGLIKREIVNHNGKTTRLVYIV